MTNKTKILFLCQEMAPYLELTEIAKITRHLPQAMQENGYEIRVLMPRFGCINERRNKLHEVIRLSGMNIVVDENDNPLIIKVASIQGAKMQVYFLDNEEYFHRKHVFNDNKGKFFDDNDERTVFFCKGVLETVKKLGWSPDIIHCHGWMSSLVPMYVKTAYKNEPTFKGSKVVYSVYGNDFKEDLGETFYKKSLTGSMNEGDAEVFGTGNAVSLHKGAIKYSDGVVVADENIAPEVEKQLKNARIPVSTIISTENFEDYPAFYEEILEEDMAEVEA
ncbi:starch synthase [Anseongella ginsenosidimutans]|uniref:starch synthase n=1 Tax=Anseongella ginsenosidimutans TaxID=496056 RepID=A0A4R3KWV2_9SPHI|nr:glycogen/starch synthase [Anseongella ginsenosidimutans]QEC51407.1 starch synthase [Anseongella ginsenosidimutans]TCS89888.1 starch synthase [Anseongella ginsenosidimutans]